MREKKLADHNKQFHNTDNQKNGGLNENTLKQEDTNRIIQNVSTFEFDQEIQQLSQQLKDKIQSLKKDYKDLKIFDNKEDIINAREKLLVFVKKLITDTNFLINSIQRNFERNEKLMKKELTS